MHRRSCRRRTREARYSGDQGCIIQHPDKPGIHFTPVRVSTTLPDAASQDWPLGGRADTRALSAGIDRATLEAATDAAFADPAALTAAFLVVHKGRIVAERYAPGITKDTQWKAGRWARVWPRHCSRGDNFLTWPQRALFDRIGIRRQILETDPHGDFLITGYDYGTACNWARIGLLHLQKGMWNGERILPKGWTDLVSTPAPAWARPEYVGLSWLNRINTWNLPPETYFAAGAWGQNTWIVPGHDLVIVRMGHVRGQGPARVRPTPHSDS